MPPSNSMSPRLIIVMLSLLLGMQAVTTDMYLPAMPAITEDLGANMSQAQLTLTALLLAFGLSQLVWGPLSDRFGRRPILLWGVGAYVLASVICVLAPSIGWLIVARAIQGVAMGAGVMTARAVVRDLFQPVQGARAMSQALTGLGMIACTCGPAGGWLTDHLGWRLALLSVAGFGLLTWWLLYQRFEETLARPDPRALALQSMWRANTEILQHPVFRTWCALSVSTYVGLFTFLASSSFVFIREMGLSKTHYGFLMLTMSLAYIVGTFWCRWMLRRTSIHRTVAFGGLMCLTSGVSMTALAYAGQGQSWYGPWAIILPVCIYMLGHGVNMPCSQSGAVAPFPHRAGTASALNGFIMMLFAFGMGGWLGLHMDTPLFTLVHGMLGWSLAVTLITWTVVQRHGKPVELTPPPPTAVQP